MGFVKNILDNETKKFLKEELEGTILKGLDKKIEVFDKFLSISKDGTDYSDLNRTLSEALKAWHKVNFPKDALISLNKTEQFLRSLVYIVDKSKYDEIIGKGQEFSNIIKYIGLTKLKKSGGLDLYLYPDEEKQGLTLDKKYKDDINQYHWAMAYSFRNVDAHTERRISQREAINTINSVLYVMLESTWKYKNVIEKLYIDELVFDGTNKDDHFNKIITSIEKNSMHESFVEMILRDESYFESINFIQKEESNDNKINGVAKGFISSLDILNNKPSNENLIKITGQAGLGKTRLMRQLQYKDAKNKRIFPVYIELKELSNPEITIIQLISKYSGLDIDACSSLMKNGGMVLYLDGLNEILSSEKHKRIVCSNIDELALKYPKSNFIVSDRINSYITVKKGVPEYCLIELDDKLILEFVSKNAVSPELENRVLKVIQENNLHDAVRTPFMLEALISLVENNNYRVGIKDEATLRANFVESLIKREAEDKLEGRADKIKILLSHIFIKDGEFNDSLSIFSTTQILARFRKCMDYFGFSVDTVEILELIVQMGILIKLSSGQEYAFANEVFREHFKDQAINIVLELD